MRWPLQTRCSSTLWLLFWSFHFKYKSIKMKKNKFVTCILHETNLLFQTSFIFCSWKPTQHKPEGTKRNVRLFTKGKWTRSVNRYRVEDGLKFTYQQGFPSNSILESLLRNTYPSECVTSQQVSTSLEEKWIICATKPWAQKREE